MCKDLHVLTTKASDNEARWDNSGTERQDFPSGNGLNLTPTIASVDQLSGKCAVLQGTNGVIHEIPSPAKLIRAILNHLCA